MCLRVSAWLRLPRDSATMTLRSVSSQDSGTLSSTQVAKFGLGCWGGRRTLVTVSLLLQEAGSADRHPAGADVHHYRTPYFCPAGGKVKEPEEEQQDLAALLCNGRCLGEGGTDHPACHAVATEKAALNSKLLL
ncbi:hypothetical protein E2C01_088119 [Portunus trituberculatus]|uniref:Uncharacterized protein n=1 Tax=Portunus trituberculatus TaxID=210409 RepID=A0A5B7JL32_PORTR|nr:hypothetical protein [Portunus trituberculatus]